MRAVFTNPGNEPHFQLHETVVPAPLPNQALIKVNAFSLNQGETRTALDASTSYIPGWDFAGVIEQAAADGSTLPQGTRVFGFIPQGSWAEYIVAPAFLMAAIPNEITDAQATCLPIAATTAYMALEAAGSLHNRKVLITGAAGGVGRFACALAALQGAKVFALSRRPHLVHQLQQHGITVSGIFSTIEEAATAGQYDVILDSIGGSILAQAMPALAPNGICVNFGNSSREATTFNVRSAEWPFTRKTCLFMGREVPPDCTPVFTHLVNLVKEGRLQTPIHAELSWTHINEAVMQLLQQQVDGKIILNTKRI